MAMCAQSICMIKVKGETWMRRFKDLVKGLLKPPAEHARSDSQQMRCPKCGSKRVERIEEDYYSPEAAELGYYEYGCQDCGYIWEVEWRWQRV